VITCLLRGLDDLEPSGGSWGAGVIAAALAPVEEVRLPSPG
jgi:hypothetical protein